MESSNRKIMTRLPETKKVTLMTFAGKYRFLTGDRLCLIGNQFRNCAGALSVHVECNPGDGYWLAGRL